MRSAEDVINRALDLIGAKITIGSIFDGTPVSEAARRIYGETLRGLLRAALWSFARKRTTLMLLADATGQSISTPTWVEPPWMYAYAWPADCVRPRWVPWSGVPASGMAVPGEAPMPGSPSAVIMPNVSVQSWGLFPYERPARFVVSTTDAYPTQLGPPVSWDALPNLDAVEGQGLVHRRTILTNVPPPYGGEGPGAQLIYTYLALEQEVWDELFRQAMVAVVGSLLARVVIDDPKEAIAERNAQIMIARQAIREARIASQNEAGFPQSINHVPDWLKARRSGPAAYWFHGPGWTPWGGGVESMGWDSFAFGDGSVI